MAAPHASEMNDAAVVVDGHHADSRARHGRTASVGRTSHPMTVTPFLQHHVPGTVSITEGEGEGEGAEVGDEGEVGTTASRSRMKTAPPVMEWRDGHVETVSRETMATKTQEARVPALDLPRTTGLTSPGKRMLSTTPTEGAPVAKKGGDFCLRHRPDMCRRQADHDTVALLQQAMEKLPLVDQTAITHVWSLFSASPTSQRKLILQGLLSQCCLPQLSFISSQVASLIRIDMLSALPPELSFKILASLDAISLARASMVSKGWKKLADDDVLWHKMCEQHIDRKCEKCGWGLPLLDRRSRLRALREGHAHVSGGPPGLSGPQVGETQPVSRSRSRSRELSFPGGAAEDDSNAPGSKRTRTASNGGSFKTRSVGGDVSPLFSSPSKTSPTKPAKHGGSTRPWKDIYCERLVLERNWRNGRYKVKTLKGHTDSIMCLQFDEALGIVATGSYDRTVRIWNLETGDVIKVLTGHTRGVRCLQFDDVKLITGSMDRTIKIWNYRTGDCVRTLQGHDDAVIAINFDNRSGLLASGSTDSSIRVWDSATGSCYALNGHRDWVNSVQIYDHGRTLISASDDTTIKIWNLQTRTCERTLQDHVGQVQSITMLPFLPDPHHPIGKAAAAAAAAAGGLNAEKASSATQRAGAREASDEAPTCLTPLGPTQDPMSSPTTTARELSRLSSSHYPSRQMPEDELTDWRSKTSALLLSASLDNTLKLWSLPSGECIRTSFGHTEGVWDCEMDSLRIVSASHDKTIKVWDREHGNCIVTLIGHVGAVTCIGLSDTRIVSGSDDWSLKIWDFRAT